MSDHLLQVSLLVSKTLGEDTEAHEVAQYCIANESIMSAAMACHHNPKMDSLPVPPESLLLMNDYQTRVVNNSFYHKHFNAITSLMTVASIRSNSRTMHLARSVEDEESQGVVRELTAQRYEVLTMIVFWEKGLDAAKKFDFMLRKEIKLTDPEKRYFKKHGVE